MPQLQRPPTVTGPMPPRHHARHGILAVVSHSGTGIFGKILKFARSDADERVSAESGIGCQL